MFIKLRLLASHPTQTKAGKEADYKSTYAYTQLTTARSISTALIASLTFHDATENAMISTNAEDAAFSKRYRVGNSGILKQQSIYSTTHPFSHSSCSCLLSHHRKVITKSYVRHTTKQNYLIIFHRASCWFNSFTEI